MATTLTSMNLTLSIGWLFENVLDVNNAKQTLTQVLDDSFADGNAVDLAQIAWADERTVTASGTDSIDIAGGITDAFGNTLTFTKLKLLALWNKSTTVGDILTIGGNANSVPFCSAANDKIIVGPNGIALLWNPSAAAYAVTGATGDIIDVIETGGANSVTYRIFLVGTDT